MGVHLGVAIYSTGEARRQALQLAALRGGKIVAFVLGAVLMTEVAAELNVAASTVSNHLMHVKEKLNAPTLGAIVAYAHRAGLIE